MSFPELADLPPDQRASGALFLRYEDVTQEGRVVLTALPQAVGWVVWRQLIREHVVTELRNRQGIVPILSRLVMEGGGGPVSVMRPLEAEGGFDLAHAVDDTGQVDRILMTIAVRVDGKIGRTAGPPPADRGAPVFVGRVVAEHVFTRPFAPAGERKVRSLDGPGLPGVPAKRAAWRPPEATLELPDGAAWIEDDLAPDEAPVVFGLAHTDSNQHVNSLVYPRLFEDAALRRFAALGEPVQVLSRYADVAYRKPCFAGDRMRWLLRAFRAGDRIGAVGCLVPDGDRAAKPHTYVQMAFAP
ncbi:MAG: hypothetical protein D6689_10415 [Deltaproteobacteria bacterium]|nr:MAG: hypothetical protein D6689_10415 [Deltaproteobacteria bacterium]